LNPKKGLLVKLGYSVTGYYSNEAAIQVRYVVIYLQYNSCGK